MPHSKPAALAELNRQVVAAKRTTEPSKLRAQLPNLSAEQAVEAVATMYALMLCPPIKEPLEREALAAVELHECRRRLGNAPSAK